MTVTIGGLTNVPAPGDPIRSPWAQDVTRIARHIFATKAALDAATPGWAGLVDGAQAWTVADALVWDRIGGAWVARVTARLLGRKIGSTVVSVPTGGAVVVANVTFTLPTGGRLIRIHGQANMSAGAGVGAYLQAGVNAAPITPRVAQVNNIGAIGGTVLTGEVMALAPAGAVTVNLTGFGIGGTASTNGTTDPTVLEVYDHGPGPLPT